MSLDHRHSYDRVEPSRMQCGKGWARPFGLLRSGDGSRQKKRGKGRETAAGSA